MDERVSISQMWKRANDDILYMVEGCDANGQGSEYSTDMLFAHIPKFSYRKSMFVVVVAAVVLVVTSYWLHVIGQPNCDSYEWLSNLLLNVSMGVVASILIYLYAAKRECAIVGYSEILAWLKEWIRRFDSLFSDEGVLRDADSSFVFQTRGDNDGIENLCKHDEFCFTMTRLFYYVRRNLAPVYTNYNFDEIIAMIERRNKLRHEKIEAIKKMFVSKKELESELKNDCCRLVWEDYRIILDKLRELAMQLESDIYGIRMGKPSVKTWQQLRRENVGKGGAINEEICKTVGIKTQIQSLEN